MPAKKIYFRLSIELKDSQTRSSREITVPADLSLDLLRMVINILFGWHGGAESAFYLGPARDPIEVSASVPSRGDSWDPCSTFDTESLFGGYSCDFRDFGDHDDDDEYDDYEDEDEFRTHFRFDELTVGQAFARVSSSFRYEYDLNEGHTHSVKIKSRNYQPQGGQYPIYCLKAAGPMGYDAETGESDDDDLLQDENGSFPPGVIDAHGLPTDKYWQLRAALNTPAERINAELARFCKNQKLRKIPKTSAP